jgi:hypothetical protein
VETADVPGQLDPDSENVAKTSAWCGVEQGSTDTSCAFGLLTQSPSCSLNTAASRYLTVTGL